MGTSFSSCSQCIEQWYEEWCDCWREYLQIKQEPISDYPSVKLQIHSHAPLFQAIDLTEEIEMNTPPFSIRIDEEFMNRRSRGNDGL